MPDEAGSFDLRKRVLDDYEVPDSDGEDHQMANTRPIKTLPGPRKRSSPAGAPELQVQLPRLSVPDRELYRTVSPDDAAGAVGEDGQNNRHEFGDASRQGGQEGDLNDEDGLNKDDDLNEEEDLGQDDDHEDDEGNSESGLEDPDNADSEPSPRPGKRRQTRAVQSPDGLSTHRGKLRVKGAPNELSASLGRYALRAPEQVNKMRKWMAGNPAVKRLADVERLLPRLPAAPNSKWTDKDRKLVERSWERHPRRERLLNVGGQKELLTLYKACLRLMHCLPEDIIGCRFNLEYDERQNRDLRAKGHSLVWSASFCKALTALLAHPMWNGSVAALAVAIQYAVIVDTDDRGPLDMQVPEHDRFLARLLARKRKQPDTKVTELREKLHDETSEPELDVFGRVLGTQVSPWDLLFQTLEDLAKAAAKPSQPAPSEPPRQPSGPFVVHRRHLDLLEKALDTMAHMGYGRFASLDVYNRAIHGRRAHQDYPQRKDLRPLRNYAILCERERLAFKEKPEAPAVTEVPSTPSAEAIPETQRSARRPKRPAPQPAQQDPTPLQPRKRVRSEVPSTSQPEPSNPSTVRSTGRAGLLEALSLESRRDQARPGDESQPGNQLETGSQLSDLFHPDRLGPRLPIVDGQGEDVMLPEDDLGIPLRAPLSSDRQHGGHDENPPPARPTILSGEGRKSSPLPQRPSILAELEPGAGERAGHPTKRPNNEPVSESESEWVWHSRSTWDIDPITGHKTQAGADRAPGVPSDVCSPLGTP